MTGAAVVAEARRWIGSPFVHAGMDRETGCDCAGLILGVGRACGLTEKHLPTYGPQTSPEVLLETLGLTDLQLVYFGCGPSGIPEEWMLAEGWGAAEPGDVVVLLVAAPRGRPHPRHLAYWTGSGLIHAEGNHGVVETPLDVRWRRRLHSVWRWRKLDGGGE